MQSAESKLTFRRNILLPSSGSKRAEQERRRQAAGKQTSACYIAYSTLKMEVLSSSDKWPELQRPTVLYLARWYLTQKQL
jgi:hypothetical protein